jgi:hypothetical protein
MSDPRLDHLGPRPPASSGWLTVRNWLRARNFFLGLPRADFPSPRCALCADLVSQSPGDRCSRCGAPIPVQAITTPESSIDLDTRETR